VKALAVILTRERGVWLRVGQRKPAKWIAAGIIISIWLVLAALAILLIVGAVRE
jgi:hypothetical protein